jgi:hypothetical protein
MKIINEYLIIDPVTGKVGKYIELEGNVFFRVSLETNNERYYWISSDKFYERYNTTKKTFEQWKETK